jgi:hypothetical protein
MSYYTRLNDDPFPGARLSVNLERPAAEIPDERMMTMRAYPGPRFRLVIEAESQFFDRIDQALASTLEEIKAEIAAAERERRSI